MQYLVLLAALALAMPALAQQNTLPAGGEASGSGGRVSFSIGQVDYTAPAGTGGMTTQGVQQPIEIYSAPTAVRYPGPQLQVEAFPNPAQHQLTLLTGTTSLRNLRCTLYDVKGRVLLAQPVTSARTTLPLTGLAAGTYVLRVFWGDTEMRVFHVIKNN